MPASDVFAFMPVFLLPVGETGVAVVCPSLPLQERKPRVLVVWRTNRRIWPARSAVAVAGDKVLSLLRLYMDVCCWISCL